MAQALPYITAVVSTYGVQQSSKTPKLPKVKDLGDPDGIQKKRNLQREQQRRASSGRASTVLTGSNTLG